MYPNGLPKTYQWTKVVLGLTGVLLIYFCFPFSYYLACVILRIFKFLSVLFCPQFIWQGLVQHPGQIVISSQESQLHLLVSIAIMCLLPLWVVCLISWTSNTSFREDMLSVLYLPPSFKSKVLTTSGRYID